MALRLQIISDQSRLLGEHAAMVFGPRGGRIGRAPDNDWVLPDPNRYLSAHHAAIHAAGDGYEVEDTSRNGVFANGADRPIGRDQRRLLADGDELRFGDYRIRVHLDPIEVHDGLSDALVAVDHVEPVRRDAASPRGTPTALEAQSAWASAGGTEIRNAGADSAALQAFCRGAGIDAASLPPGADAKALLLAGQLLRESVLGMQELLRAQRGFHQHLHTTPAPSNAPGPAPDSASCGDYLLTLLGGHVEGRVDAIQALRAQYGSLRRHDAALAPTVINATAAFLQHLSPEVVEGRARSQGDAEQAWPLFVKLYRSLTTTARGDLPPLFAEALNEAYDRATRSGDGPR